MRKLEQVLNLPPNWRSDVNLLKKYGVVEEIEELLKIYEE